MPQARPRARPGGTTSSPAQPLRPFRSGDGLVLARIYRAAVSSLAARHYTPQQRDAWLSRAPSAADFESAYRDGRATVLALDGAGVPVGFTDLERDGHIQFLYVDPGAAGRGVGAALLAELTALARHAGLARMTAEASETALPSFLRAGFICLNRRDFAIDGVAIHNYAVALRLAR